MDDPEANVNTWDNLKLAKAKLKTSTQLSGISATSTGYYNEQQDLRMDEIGPAIPSILISEVGDIDMRNKYKIFRDGEELMKLFVKRSTLQSEEKNKILPSEIKNNTSKNFLSLSLYFAYVSLLNVGSDIDAVHLYDSINLFFHKDEILREILCTRSFKQIQEIKNRFKKMYGYDLCDMISKCTSGSKRKFFYSLLNEKRSSSVQFDQNDHLLSDFKLFLDEQYYKKNKEKFIDLFTKKSYYEIHQMCIEFERVNSKTLVDTLKGYTKSRLKKYAKTICLISINSHDFFSKLLAKYIDEDNTAGAIRIMVLFAEIDIMTTMELNTYKLHYTYINWMDRVIFSNRPTYYGTQLWKMAFDKNAII